MIEPSYILNILNIDGITYFIKKIKPAEVIAGKNEQNTIKEIVYQY